MRADLGDAFAGVSVFDEPYRCVRACVRACAATSPPDALPLLQRVHRQSRVDHHHRVEGVRPVRLPPHLLHHDASVARVGRPQPAAAAGYDRHWLRYAHNRAPRLNARAPVAVAPWGGAANAAPIAPPPPPPQQRRTPAVPTTESRIKITHTCRCFTASTSTPALQRRRLRPLVASAACCSRVKCHRAVSCKFCWCDAEEKCLHHHFGSSVQLAVAVRDDELGLRLMS